MGLNIAQYLEQPRAAREYPRENIEAVISEAIRLIKCGLAAG